jgi:hypothetical protein
MPDSLNSSLEPSPERGSVAPVVAGAIAVVAAVAIQVFPAKVTLCDAKGYCRDLNKTEYRELKSDLRQKFVSNATSTFEEYQTFITILDREVKAKGGFTIEDVKSPDDIRSAVDRFLSTD